MHPYKPPFSHHPRQDVPAGVISTVNRRSSKLSGSFYVT